MADFHLPLRTRLNFLKVPDTLQEEIIQDDCPHESFEDGICKECEWKCEHDIEDWGCLICGKDVSGDLADYGDYLYDQWKERDL